MIESLLRIDQVQKRLQISRTTIHRLIAQGRLNTVYIGSSVRVRESDLLQFIDELDK